MLVLDCPAPTTWIDVANNAITIGLLVLAVYGVLLIAWWLTREG